MSENQPETGNVTNKKVESSKRKIMKTLKVCSIIIATVWVMVFFLDAESLNFMKWWQRAGTCLTLIVCLAAALVAVEDNN